MRKKLESISEEHEEGGEMQGDELVDILIVSTNNEILKPKKKSNIVIIDDINFKNNTNLNVNNHDNHSEEEKVPFLSQSSNASSLSAIDEFVRFDLYRTGKNKKNLILSFFKNILFQAYHVAPSTK